MPEEGNGDRQPWELIAKAQSGNTEAFDELWWRYAKSVRGQAEALVVSHGCRRSLVPDMVQAFWIKVWQKIPTYDPTKSAFRTWLGSVLQNHWVDYIRSTGKFEAMTSVDKDAEDTQEVKAPADGQPSFDATGTDPVRDERAPDIQAELADLSKAIEDAAANLSPEQAQAFRECVLNGRSSEEVADETGTASTTVRKRVERARQAIVNRLNGLRG